MSRYFSTALRSEHFRKCAEPPEVGQERASLCTQTHYRLAKRPGRLREGASTKLLISESSEGTGEHIGAPDLNPAPALLCYCDRGANRGIFKKLNGHASRQTDAAVRRGEGRNVALVHCVSSPKEHRVRHSRAIEMAPFRTDIFS